MNAKNAYVSATREQVNKFKRTRLPFEAGTKFSISQVASGKESHGEPSNEFSWDFEVPYGTPVVAVEDGKVIDVSEPDSGGGCDQKYASVAHNIKVQHEDGTVAQYVHVSSLVKPGTEIREGQIVGVTAMNGWICKPQLHFGIYRSKDQLYNSPKRETVPLIFDGLPGDTLALSGLTVVVPEGLTIKLVKETPATLETKRLLDAMLKKYDLAGYFFTTKIQIDTYVIPHDYPILTLNTRHNNDPDFLLATFLHEEVHRFLSGPYDQLTQRAINDLKLKFLKVPVGGQEGGYDEESTYLHLIVCWHELQAVKKFLGEQRAYDIIRRTDHYTWIYKQVLEHEEEIGLLIEQNGLSIRSPRAVRSFYFPQPFVRTDWMADFSELEQTISKTYPNLETKITDKKLNLQKMDVETRVRLDKAATNLDAFLALLDFVDKFKDGHFHLKVPDPVPTDSGSYQPISLNGSTPGNLACQKVMGPTKPKDLGFLFPTPTDGGFGAIQIQANAFPYTTLNIAGKRVGFVRIASFGLNDYPDLCANEWERFRVSLTGVCDDKCQDKFVHQTLSNRLLSEFAETLHNLEAEKIDALLLDLTNNGGGTDWVGAVTRMITGKPILCGQFGFIRHPHWIKHFNEEISDIKSKIETVSGPEGRMKMEAKLRDLKVKLKEASVRCDRSKIWNQENYSQNCSLVVRRPVKDCSPSEEFHFQSGIYTGPLFVLVNDRTASASEDLVGRHKDSKTATIIGERTHGSGCGYTDGGIPLKLSHSGVSIVMPDCARFLRDGTNEVLGIAPDIKMQMFDLRADAFTNRLKKILQTEISK